MSRNIIAIALTILLIFISSVYSEKEMERDGLSPDELEALRQHNEGTESMLTKKYDEAILCFKKAIDLNPKLMEAYYNLGIAYEGQGKHKDSIDALKEAIQLDPSHANAHYALGYAYYKLKKYNDSVAAFKQSIKIKPDSAFAHSKLGQVYIIMGNKEAARKQYETLKTLDSTLASELYREIIKDKK
jgi:tetratricopeptide (TPR) repeat protein